MMDQNSCFSKCIGVLLAAAIIFTVWPGLDLWVSNYFYVGNGLFPANDIWIVKAIYHLTPWLGRLMFFVAVAVVLFAIFFQDKVSRRHWRRSSAIVSAKFFLSIQLFICQWPCCCRFFTDGFWNVRYTKAAPILDGLQSVTGYLDWFGPHCARGPFFE